MRPAIALVFAFALGALAAPAGSQELGRLFHTPEQRRALDARRVTRPSRVTPAAPAPSQPARIDGYVLRSDGRSTVWVNSGAMGSASPPEGMRADVRRDAPGRVSVIVGGGAKRHEVKVGETLDAGSGSSSDLIGEGEIKVRR